MIELVFEQLKKLNAVSSSNEFSRDWLGMEKSYYRTMKAKNRQPSAKVLARVPVKLKENGKKLEKNSNPTVAKIGRRLLVMSDKCISEILNS